MKTQKILYKIISLFILTFNKYKKYGNIYLTKTKGLFQFHFWQKSVFFWSVCKHLVSTVPEKQNIKMYLIKLINVIDIAFWNQTLRPVLCGTLNVCWWLSD